MHSYHLKYRLDKKQSPEIVTRFFKSSYEKQTHDFKTNAHNFIRAYHPNENFELIEVVVLDEVLT